MNGASAFSRIIKGSLPRDGETTFLRGVPFRMADGVLRRYSEPDTAESQLSDFYHKHWTVPGAYDDTASDDYQAEIFKVMFGDVFEKIATHVAKDSVVLDVGCGAGVAGRVFFHSIFNDIHYVGADMSLAVDQAKTDFAERGLSADFIQADIESLPLEDESVDVIFCPGVLHYTGGMRDSVRALTRCLKKGGLFITWVYKKQKPVRQLTDTLLRDHFSAMAPEAAFKEMESLTKFGIALGELGVKITVPEDVPVLDLKKGEYDLQRLFYYHFMKLFYHPDLTFTRHNVNNWNAYYPANVLFPSEDEVKDAFTANGMDTFYFHPHGNGISVAARK